MTVCLNLIIILYMPIYMPYEIWIIILLSLFFFYCCVYKTFIYHGLLSTGGWYRREVGGATFAIGAKTYARRPRPVQNDGQSSAGRGRATTSGQPAARLQCTPPKSLLGVSAVGSSQCVQ